MHRHPVRAYTLVEMLMTMGLVGIVGLSLAMFTSTSTRFVARNLATNHSHEAARLSSQTLLKELRDSASSFRLLNATGLTFTDVPAAASAEVDSLTHQFISTRTNGVRFRQLVGGPYPLANNTLPNDSALMFALQGGVRPEVGDKLVLPLISREYDVTAVSGTFSPNGTVTISPAIGYTLNTVSPNVITGYFYRRVAFTVEGEELRYHPNFNGASRATYKVVRGGVTSPKPFSLLFPSATSLSTDALDLRVSMEFTDLAYSARKFGNGTTTLHTIFPPRNQPTAVTSTN